MTIARGRAWLLKDRAFALSVHVNGEIFRKACSGEHKEVRRALEREMGVAPDTIDAVCQYLAASGAPCDCLALWFLEQGKAAGPSGPLPEDPALLGWCLPERYRPDPARRYTKLLRGGYVPLGHQYARDGELLVPAPGLHPPGRVIRPGVHFFLGLESGLPAEHGVVAVEREPWTAARLVEAVRASAAREPLERFSEREASFFLDALDRCDAGHFFGAAILKVLTDERLVPELTLRRVIPRFLES